MTRVTSTLEPLLLGFEEIERLIDRAAKRSVTDTRLIISSEFAKDGDASELLRITLAVAGFTRDRARNHA